MTSLVSNCNILISTNILTNISRSTGNLSMKFGQLIEYDMRTFSWKIIPKMWGRTIPRPFSKNIKLSIYLDQFFYFFNSVGFYRMPSWRLSKYIEIKLQITCFYLIKSFFKRNKERSETSFPGSFYAWFLKINISPVIFYYLTKFHCLVAFTSWDIGQYMYCDC